MVKNRFFQVSIKGFHLKNFSNNFQRKLVPAFFRICVSIFDLQIFDFVHFYFQPWWYYVSARGKNKRYMVKIYSNIISNFFFTHVYFKNLQFGIIFKIFVSSKKCRKLSDCCWLFCPIIPMDNMKNSWIMAYWKFFVQIF